MITNQKTQNLNYSEDINNLLCELDVKISKISEEKLNSQRFGYTCKIDENVFFILSFYRDILKQKAQNSCCLKNYLIDDIINIIKQYLTSGKVLKFKPSTSLEETTSVEQKPKVNMYTIYNYYGDNITYYHSSNRYITEGAEDYWDQTDW